MIIPSIDLQSGNAVQMIGGERRVLDAGDPKPIARQFGLVGEIAVIDLDGALQCGSNSEIIHDLMLSARCRVGGGIRDSKTAIAWLDAGAQKVILGTAATPDVLRELPSERTIAAIDSRYGKVVVDGWRTSTGATVIERMRELRPYVGGFLVTFVENEGRMTGVGAERVRQIVEAAGGASVTIAGGVKSPADIAMIDSLGADAQVGMGLYTGAFDLADVLDSLLHTDRSDGLVPTVVCDEQGCVLGLCYSNVDSLREAISTQTGVYFSRSRNEIWRKGATSGNTQKLINIDMDCDQDTLRFIVHQEGVGFCHMQTRSCFGECSGFPELIRRVAGMTDSAPDGSYTAELLAQPELLARKLAEESIEVGEADTAIDVMNETADLLYFLSVKLAGARVNFATVERELDRRVLKVTRRSQTSGEKSCAQLQPIKPTEVTP